MKFPVLLPNIFNHPFTYECQMKLKVGDFVEVTKNQSGEFVVSDIKERKNYSF